MGGAQPGSPYQTHQPCVRGSAPTAQGLLPVWSKLYDAWTLNNYWHLLNDFR